MSRRIAVVVLCAVVGAVAWLSREAPRAPAVPTSAPRRAGLTSLIRSAREHAWPLRPSPASIALAPGMVTGHVRDDAGAPIAGARVTLSAGFVDAPLAEATTDDAGAYALVPPPVTFDTVRRFYAVRAPGYARGGETRSDAGDVIDFDMIRGARASGRVALADGTPCPGADVRIRVHREPDGYQHASATSDADGRFRIDTLEPGDLTIEAYGPGCATRAELELSLPLGGHADELHVVAERTVALAGIARDARTHRPLAGARIEGNAFDTPLNAISDADGRFALDAEAGRTYTVTAHHAGYLLALVNEVTPGTAVELLLAPARTVRGHVVPPGPAEVAVFTESWSSIDEDIAQINDAHATADASGAFTLTMPAGDFKLVAKRGDGARGEAGVVTTDGDVANVRIEVAPLGDAELRGVVVDDSGEPVAATDVFVGFGPGTDDFRATSTSAAGTFAIAHLPRTEVSVVVESRMSAGQPVRVDLTAGSREQRFAVASYDAQVRVRVTWDDGSPAAGAWIRGEPRLGEYSGSVSIAQGRADARGEVVLRHLAHAGYTISATSPDGDSTASVLVREGEDAEVHLVPMYPVVVRARRDGAWLASAHLSCETADGRWSSGLTLSSTLGKRVTRARRGTRLACQAEVRGGVGRATLDVSSTRTEMIIDVGPTTMVRGRLVDRAGAPSRSPIHASGPRDLDTDGHVDDDGAFELQVVPGHATLWTYGREGNHIPLRELDAVAGQVVDVGALPYDAAR